MSDNNSCKHLKFHVDAAVSRLTKEEGGPVLGFTADIKIRCADCWQSFAFLGLESGSSPNRPMVSFGGDELRAPITPIKG